MAMMTLVADVHADVVQQRAELEPLALAIAEPMHRARLVEDRQGELRHLPRVLRPVAAAFAELDRRCAAGRPDSARPS